MGNDQDRLEAWHKTCVKEHHVQHIWHYFARETSYVAMNQYIRPLGEQCFMNN